MEWKKPANIYLVIIFVSFCSILDNQRANATACTTCQEFTIELEFDNSEKG